MTVDKPAYVDKAAAFLALRAAPDFFFAFALKRGPEDVFFFPPLVLEG